MSARAPLKLTLQQNFDNITVLHLEVLSSGVVKDTLSVENETTTLADSSSIRISHHSPDSSRVLANSVGVGGLHIGSACLPFGRLGKPTFSLLSLVVFLILKKTSEPSVARSLMFRALSVYARQNDDKEVE